MRDATVLNSRDAANARLNEVQPARSRGQFLCILPCETLMISLKLRQNETILNALQWHRLSEFSVTGGRVSPTCLLRSPACHKNANQPQSSCLLRRACKNMHSSFPSALFLIQEFLTCTIQIALTWWLGITLALKMLYTPFIFHPRHLTKTLVWQKQIRWHRCIHGLMFAALIRICDIERDKQNQLVRLRRHYHPRLRDIRDVAARACGQGICRAAD